MRSAVFSFDPRIARTTAAALLAGLLACTTAIAAEDSSPWAKVFSGFEAPPLPPGTVVQRGLAYGGDPAQQLDVYHAANAHGAPVILLVHGGGWRRGGRDNPGLAAPKAAHWLPQGYVLASTDYRMLPGADPLTQAQDVAHALAYVQQHAREWGGDPDKVILMGHSAGAHLVALLGADPAQLRAAGARRPLGVVSLDSAAMDVPQLMEAPRHPRLYDDAFGSDPGYWKRASPFHQLGRDAVPMLAVCSSRRSDSCPQARALASRAASFGVTIKVQPEDLSHMQINRELGAPSDYTRVVDAYLQQLLHAHH